jgi:hypothetical protein
VSRRTLETGAVAEEVAVPIYSPSTPDPQLATTIALAPGENASSVDVQLAGSRVPAHHVRGVVQNFSASGRLLRQVVVVSRAQLPMATVPIASVAADGAFDVAGVAAGSYVVYTREGGAATPIEVGDADVDNVVLTETPGVNIPGRVTLERGTSATGPVDLSNLAFQVQRDPAPIGTPQGGPRFNPPPAADGSFAWTLSPGDYRVSAMPLDNRQRDERTRAAGGPPVSDALQNAYVKSMRWGPADVLADGLHTWGGAQGTLEVVVSLAGAEVGGTVRDVTRQPAAGVIVVAVPDGGNRGRRDLSRRATTDSAGHFALRGLAPGDYSFYAWDDLERGAWESAEFLRGFEGRGLFVRLREGRNDTLDLNLLAGRQ